MKQWELDGVVKFIPTHTMYNKDKKPVLQLIIKENCVFYQECPENMTSEDIRKIDCLLTDAKKQLREKGVALFNYEDIKLKLKTLMEQMDANGALNDGKPYDFELPALDEVTGVMHKLLVHTYVPTLELEDD